MFKKRASGVYIFPVSLSSTFSMNIPELPIQLLAVTENNLVPPFGASSGQTLGGGGASFADLEALLLNEGNIVADRLNAHFMTSTSAIQQKSKAPKTTFNPTIDLKNFSEE